MTDFCDEDEGLWWHPGTADMYAEPQYWRHDAHREAHYRRASTDARRRPREICTTAAAPLPGGRGIMGVNVWTFPPDGRKDGGIRIRPLSDKNGWDNAVETWVGARR
jgi:hypothetical protein